MHTINSPVQTSGPRPTATARICDSLRRRIQQGDWLAGAKLPSEPDLAREFKASRGTLRGALAALESEGLLIRRHGSGTYVAARRLLVNSLHINKSADQMISETGRYAGTSELTWRRMPADESLRAQLALNEGEEVFRLFRIRTADGSPVSVSYDYVSTAIIPDQPALLGPSLYAFLADVCGVKIEYGLAELAPIQADAELARYLEVEEGSLCLALSQVDFDAGNRPRSLSVEYHLASAFRFELLRQGPARLGHD